MASNSWNTPPGKRFVITIKAKPARKALKARPVKAAKDAVA